VSSFFVDETKMQILSNKFQLGNIPFWDCTQLDTDYPLLQVGS
jgi:hypothetical protein